MPKMVSRWIHLILPIRNLNYFHEYLNILDQLERNQNKRKLWQVCLIAYPTLFQSIRHAYLAVMSSTLSDYDLVIQYNPTYIALGNNLYNILWMTIGL